MLHAAAFSEIQRDEETNGQIALLGVRWQKTTRGRPALELHCGTRSGGGSRQGTLGFFRKRAPRVRLESRIAERRCSALAPSASVLKVLGGQPRRSSRPPSAKAELTPTLVIYASMNLPAFSTLALKGLRRTLFICAFLSSAVVGAFCILHFPACTQRRV